MLKTVNGTEYNITSHADLSYADLSYANLRGTDLYYANLRGTDLRGTNLRRADLSYANLRGADLSYADLSYADLRGTYLRGAKNIPALSAAELSVAPPEGDVIGWKKCRYGVIVKLRIPADARRSNATGRKCRAEYAEVLEVIGANQAETCFHGPTTVYRPGETVYPDAWDDNRWNECSNGIHFYITREEAEAHIY